jgi:hypothetical protein
MYFIMKYAFLGLYVQFNVELWSVEDKYGVKERHMLGFGEET